MRENEVTMCSQNHFYQPHSGIRMGCYYLLANSAQFLEASLFYPLQDCFWRGKTSQSHKQEHDVREYSTWVRIKNFCRRAGIPFKIHLPPLLTKDFEIFRTLRKMPLPAKALRIIH